MKIRNIFYAGMTVCCLFLLSQNAIGQKLVKDLAISKEEAKVQFAAATPSSYFVEIGGPNNYYMKQRVDYKNTLSLSNLKKDGKKFEDGSYTLQITPIINLTDEQRALLLEVRKLNDVEAIAKFRRENNLPDVIEIYSVNFGIKNGQFITPETEGKLNLPTYSSKWETDHPTLYASINTVEMNYSPKRATDNTNTVVDQVILDDLIVDGSACIGFDCVNGESFGFDTLRLKENNLRIKFQDTSNSASFPDNDWQITANDSSNGGANKFSIDDIDGGRTPFTIEASAPSHSLYVDDAGRIGLGTSTPVVEMHVKDGDTPTMRLEQDGSSGFGPQTWDVAGNETNFFVRDASNGSTLPFRIRPSAPSNSIYIDTDGDVGLGTSTPLTKLEIKGDLTLDNINEDVSVIRGPSDNEQRLAITQGESTGNSSAFISMKGYETDNGGASAGQLTMAGSFVDFKYAKAYGGFGTLGMRLTDAGGVAIGGTTVASGSLLHVYADITATGMVNSSDRNLKKDIQDFKVGLKTLKEINPVTFKYNGKANIKSTRTHVGLIAQDVQKVAPFMVMNYNFEEHDDNNNVVASEDYLAIDATAIQYVLVNAVKEQQAIIDAQKAEINTLKAEVASLQELKAQVAELTQMVMKQNATGNTQTGEDK